ncbi:unnamed protein product, partial [Symbiodinium sp. KB8]
LAAFREEVASKLQPDSDFDSIILQANALFTLYHAGRGTSLATLGPLSEMSYFYKHKLQQRKVQLYQNGQIMAPEAELDWIARAFGDRLRCEVHSDKFQPAKRRHKFGSDKIGQMPMQQIADIVKRWPQTAYVPGVAVPLQELIYIRNTKVSLDLTAAFDLVNWSHLREALALAQLDPSVQELLLQWLRQVVYYFNHRGQQTKVRPSWGLRQGCPASPVLWSVFTALLCQAFDSRLQAGWAAQHAVMYADDSHLRWQFDTYEGFERALTELRIIMRIFSRFDMCINCKKTQAILLLSGPDKQRVHKHYVRAHPEGKRLLLLPGDPGRWLPLVDRAEYLGLIIAYDRFEALSTRHRIAKANQRRWALASILHSRKFGVRYKLQIWRSCVQTTLLYGLHSFGLSPKLYQEVVATSMKHIRAIVADQQHLTGNTHQDIRERFQLATPLVLLCQAHHRELQLLEQDWMTQADWNLHITQSLLSLRQERKEDVSTTEQECWACPECDDTFPTAAALKIHAQRKLDMSFQEPDQEMAEFFGIVKKGTTPGAPGAPGPEGAQKRRRETEMQRSRWSGWDVDSWENTSRHMGYRGHSGRDPLLISVARLALRHEEELKLLQQDTTMVLWFSPGQDSVLPFLYQTALTFKKKQQTEPTWGLAHVPLKQVMATAMFRELRERFTKVLQNPELLKKATDMGWRDNQGWVYQLWNPQLKHLERDHHRAPVTDVEMTNKLEFFITHLKRDVVHRFHCTRKLTETMDSKATFHLDLSVRNKHAEEIWDLMTELQGNTVFQLIGLGYRRERLGRGPGAQKVYDMLRSS